MSIDPFGERITRQAREAHAARLYSCVLGREDRLVNRGVLLLSLVLVAAFTPLGLPGAGQSAGLDRFVGDFEVDSPGWQQFDGLQYEQDRSLAESYGLVETPVRQGRRAVRLTSQPGYSMFGHNESTQLLWNGGEQEGQQYWYAWSTLFPRDWKAPHKWGIFAEWHAKLGTAPLIGFSAQHDRAELSILSGLIDEKTNSAAVNRVVPLLPTLSKGRWNDFVMHVGWSTRNVGFVDVYHRVEGTPSLRKLVSFRNMSTFQVTKEGRGIGTYLLLGMYRGSYCAQPTQLGCTSSLGVQPPSTIYHDSFVRERTFEAAVRSAFPGSPPMLPSSETRAVQQEGSRLAAVDVRVARPREARSERGCGRCRVVSKDGRVVARIAGARDDRDTAVLTYQLTQRGAIVIRHRLRVLAPRLTGPLVVAQLQDAKKRTLAELYVGEGGTLRLSSPRGALRPRGFDVDTGIAAAPGAEPRQVELRLTRDEVLFAVSGRLVVRLTDLVGPARGARVDARVGIERYEGRGGGAVSAVYDELVVGSS